MDHLAVDLQPLNNYREVQKLRETYLSEIIYNEWLSVCIKYAPNVISWKIQVLIQIISSVVLVPILITANGKCPFTSTFEVILRDNDTHIKLNTSYELNILGDLYCQFNLCDNVTKAVGDGKVDPIKIYINVYNYGSMFKRNEEIYIWGRTAGVIRYLRTCLPNDFRYIMPDRTVLKEMEIMQSFKSIAPLKMDNATFGKSG